MSEHEPLSQAWENVEVVLNSLTDQRFSTTTHEFVRLLRTAVDERTDAAPLEHRIAALVVQRDLLERENKVLLDRLIQRERERDEECARANRLEDEIQDALIQRDEARALAKLLGDALEAERQTALLYRDERNAAEKEAADADEALEEAHIDLAVARAELERLTGGERYEVEWWPQEFMEMRIQGWGTVLLASRGFYRKREGLAFGTLIVHPEAPSTPEDEASTTIRGNSIGHSMDIVGDREAGAAPTDGASVLVAEAVDDEAQPQGPCLAVVEPVVPQPEEEPSEAEVEMVAEEMARVQREWTRTRYTAFDHMGAARDLLRRLSALRAEAPSGNGLTFAALRRANLARLPHFRNKHGGVAHSEPDGSDWSPAQWLQAVIGELGEYANLRKKLERGDLTTEEFARNAADELADVQTYLDILAYQLGIDLGAATASKWDVVSERVGYAGRIADFVRVTEPGSDR